MTLQTEVEQAIWREWGAPTSKYPGPGEACTGMAKAAIEAMGTYPLDVDAELKARDARIADLEGRLREGVKTVRNAERILLRPWSGDGTE